MRAESRLVDFSVDPELLRSPAFFQPAWFSNCLSPHPLCCCYHTILFLCAASLRSEQEMGRRAWAGNSSGTALVGEFDSRSTACHPRHSGSGGACWAGFLLAVACVTWGGLRGGCLAAESAHTHGVAGGAGMRELAPLIVLHLVQNSPHQIYTASADPFPNLHCQRTDPSPNLSMHIYIQLPGSKVHWPQ